MPKDFPRSRRVADQLQRELADIIRQEIKDPRVGLITITSVEVTNDLEHAKIFVTSLTATDAPSPHEAVLAALRRATGYMRSQLAHRMKLRLMPQLSFVYDDSTERGMHLSQLIDQAIADDAKHPKED